ncbi:MAG: GNAT family N-acetyltransferase [Spirochaetaceae bacterium]|nr:GNAT family N-acetyltransferase [Spirochaetaceae bacterium]
MSWTVVRLQADEFAQAIDLINFVFSHTYGPHDFETMLPKLYRPEPELVRCHWGVREDGALVALAGSYPLTWQVGETALRVAGIGAVATHPRHRGRGLMRAVVGRCVAEARAAGCHLSWLDGLGHRYRHFGYERAGAEVSFQLTERDFAVAGIDAGGMRFRRLREGDALLEQAARLHAGQRVHWRRPPAELPRICASWGGALYAAMEREKLVAYLVAARDRSTVTELVAADAATAVRVAAAWRADRSAPRVKVAVSPWQHALARRLGALADSTRVQCCGNWQVFDWPAVLAALLAERARSEPLPAGEAVVEIAGDGRLRLWVHGAEAVCEPTDAEPHIRLTAAEALRALGGPLPGAFPAPAAVPAALGSWCPLPFHIPSADRL